MGAEQYRRFRQSEIVKKSEYHELTREGDLLCSASEKVANSFNEITHQCLAISHQVPTLDPSKTGWARRQKRQILQSICDVLRQDRRYYAGPGDYFKATLFRVSSPDVLLLDCSHYPSGQQPNTEKMVRNPKSLATAFHCLDRQSMQVIENIPKELDKGAEARWVELYPGQAKKYASMLCTPICVGDIATKSFKVVSILTIDTNRLDYFSEQQSEMSFLGKLLAPFSSQLGFIYVLTANEVLTGKDEKNDEKRE